jgi:hypothetical protein
MYYINADRLGALSFLWISAPFLLIRIKLGCFTRYIFALRHALKGVKYEKGWNRNGKCK